jgi:hypothetical protein
MCIFLLRIYMQTLLFKKYIYIYTREIIPAVFFLFLLL